MISLDLWRAQIGRYNSRRMKRKGNSLSNFIHLQSGMLKFCSFLCSLVLIALLIIGGVEQNPGPPKKLVVEEKDTPGTLETGEDLIISDISDSVFTLPTSSITTSKPFRPQRQYFGGRKRSKSFQSKSISSDFVSGSEDILADSQTSVTDNFESLCKIPRLSQTSSQSSLDIPPEFSEHILTSSFDEERQTTAQKKLGSRVENITENYEEVHYLNIEKDTDEIAVLSPISICLFDCEMLGHAIQRIFSCKDCKSSKLSFYKSKFTAGIVERIFIICSSCHVGTDFYNSDKITIQQKSYFVNNILQILGGRIVGIGKSSLDILNSFMGMPKTLSKRAFYTFQKSLSHIVVNIAKNSCERAANELRAKYQVPEDDMLEVEVSYDGAYQRRGGSKGGGHSRYCFASAISTVSGKVLDFEVACNSCRLWTEKQQALRENRIGRDQYVDWFSKHQKDCQAKEYGDINSVALESKLAPLIFERSIDKKLIYSSVVADGDDKSISILKEKNFMLNTLLISVDKNVYLMFKSV